MLQEQISNQLQSIVESMQQFTTITSIKGLNMSNLSTEVINTAVTTMKDKEETNPSTDGGGKPQRIQKKN